MKYNFKNYLYKFYNFHHIINNFINLSYFKNNHLYTQIGTKIYEREIRIIILKKKFIFFLNFSNKILSLLRSQKVIKEFNMIDRNMDHLHKINNLKNILDNEYYFDNNLMSNFHGTKEVIL
jgi:hypothetical protein